MKAYVAITGILFALFALMHFVIAFEHARGAGGGPPAAVGPLAVGLASALFAVWALRIYRSLPGGRSRGAA